MKNAHHRAISTPVELEINRIVSRAARGIGFLRAGEQAYLLAKAYPDCGLSGSELANEISSAAARAGVAVEVPRPLQVSA